MENYRPQIGTPIDELDTPCLLIDMDALEHNYRTVAETYRNTEVKMRQHAKNIKSPMIARMQIRTGGTVGGVCTAKVSEAEVMVDGGIDDILVTSQVATRDKLARLCNLAKRAEMKVVVDDPRNLRELSEIANENNVTVGVLIEVDTSMHRAGVRGADRAVELAKQASQLPGVMLRGVMSHQTLQGKPDRETRYIEGRRYMQICLDVKDAVESAGIPVETVSTGESWTIDVAADLPGVTEVEGGTYALMSHSYDYLEDYDIAAKILCTVVSTPRPGVAIGDVGVRALASPRAVLPAVEGMSGIAVEALHDEHIVLRSEGDMPLKAGDKFLLSSGQQDIMVNRWDQFIGVRNGRVEAVYDISARGCHN